MDSAQKASHAAETSFLGSSPQSGEVETVQEFQWESFYLKRINFSKQSLQIDLHRHLESFEQKDYVKINFFE